MRPRPAKRTTWVVVMPRNTAGVRTTQLLARRLVGENRHSQIACGTRLPLQIRDGCS
jgi:hypothetical protein